MTSPLLDLPGAVAGVGADASVPGHHGDPLAEQRAMDRNAAVVDRSHRGVLAVRGEERLSWLHLLITQHVAQLLVRRAAEPADARARVKETLALMSALSAWGEEMLRLEPATLMKVMKLGGKIQKLLRDG